MIHAQQRICIDLEIPPHPQQEEKTQQVSDLALCQAAAGGDLLFLEACQQRGLRCQVLLPFDEPEFLERSVLPATDGARWSDRFFAALGAANTTLRVMPTELGPAPDGVDPFERCNLWLLYSALAIGVHKVRFIALWDGGRGDGCGGTAHMVDEVKRLTGRVTVFDTRARRRDMFLNMTLFNLRSWLHRSEQPDRGTTPIKAPSCTFGRAAQTRTHRVAAAAIDAGRHGVTRQARSLRMRDSATSPAVRRRVTAASTRQAWKP